MGTNLYETTTGGQLNIPCHFSDVANPSSGWEDFMQSSAIYLAVEFQPTLLRPVCETESGIISLNKMGHRSGSLASSV